MSTDETNRRDEKLADAIFHISAAVVQLKEVIKDHAIDEDRNHEFLRDAIAKLDVQVALLHAKQDETRREVRESTDPHFKLNPDEREIMTLARGISWKRVGMMLRWLLPILFAGGTGALIRDVFGSDVKPAAVIDGGIKETR